jgi:hypothetical protein
MDTQDRQAIEKLFSKLSGVEGQGGHRDPESELFIKERISTQPGAPYFMAQTIVVQEQALAAAEDRIRELERARSPQPQQSRGFLLSIFGNANSPQYRSTPSDDRQSPWGQPQSSNGLPSQGRGGGGFLAGAAQTAMGVAGGVMLGSALSGMFGGTEAKAAERVAEKPAEQSSENQEAGTDLGFEDDDF